MTIFDNPELPDENPGDKKPLGKNRFALLRKTHAAINNRVQQKEQLVVDFIGVGEVYSTKNILSHVLKLGERQTQVTLANMVKKNLLLPESLSPSIKIYGLTATGAALVRNPEHCRTLQVGKTVLNTVQHHILTQKFRLAFESTDATNWIPGKLMYQNKFNPLKNVPDASFVRGGQLYAVEIEIHLKTEKRYREIFQKYVEDMDDTEHGKPVLWMVYYFTKHVYALNQLLDRLVPPKYRDRFRVLVRDFEIHPYVPDWSPNNDSSGEQNE